MNTPAEIPFQELLETLENTDEIFPSRYLYRLSDLSKNETKQLTGVWESIPTQRKQAVMEDVEALCSENILLSFVHLGLLALEDKDDKVRLLAVRTLWEYDDFQLIPVFIERLEKDNNNEVRSAATGALGKYIFFGEIEEIPAATLQEIEDKLLQIMEGDDMPAVQRAALESLGFSSRPEVDSLIENAYASNENEWKVSALFAMARSANMKWQEHVVEMLDNIHPTLRREAAFAAGELEIPEAAPQLIELLDDPDQITRHNSIWALSQIATEGIEDILHQLHEETEDEQEAEFIQDAIDNLEFNLELHMLPLLDLLEDEELNIDNADQSFIDGEGGYIE
jgi:HEAT repeat protein